MVIASSFAYLLALFCIAYYAERRAGEGRSRITPQVYALSLAVYCTAWTYYGSVGNAASEGLSFLLIFLGPAIGAPLWWVALRKMIRICKAARITSMADFLSARYGKSAGLGGWAALLFIAAVVPYVALQLKAVGGSLEVLASLPGFDGHAPLRDPLLYITLGLAAFTVLFGVRRLDAADRHEGLVLAVAFESACKLAAFLAVGAYAVYGIYDGWGDLFRHAAALPELARHFTLPETKSADWFWTMLLSGLAILLLPRQFQMAVVENADERHVARAIWQFPLYLLLINLFVLPLAFAGRLHFGAEAGADLYVLRLPLAWGQPALALLAYLGGFSAAASMVAVSVSALAIMFSNNLFVPFWLRRRSPGTLPAALVRHARWGGAVGILLLAYGYCRYVAADVSLVSIGLTSFVGVAQFAPSVLLGLFWEEGSRKGAYWGLGLGFSVWAYALVAPQLWHALGWSQQWLETGPGGLWWLKPSALMGLEGLSHVNQAFVWSLALNACGYVAGSLLDRPSALEREQARFFVGIFEAEGAAPPRPWKHSVLAADVEQALARFLGPERAGRVLQAFSRRYGQHALRQGQADARLLPFAEAALAGAIGTAGARLLLGGVGTQAPVPFGEVVGLLEESQQLLVANRQLRQTTEALRLAQEELSRQHDRLKEQDELKDEFLYTVTHELRTPLTSIRALAEILHDHPDMEEEERGRFLHTIVKESERLTRLISQVLDLEKFESGRLAPQWEAGHLGELVQEACAAFRQPAAEAGILLEVEIGEGLGEGQFDHDRLTQAVVNLVSNALKACEAMPEGRRRVRVRAEAAGGRALLRIRDWGRGIPPEALPFIFDKFYQAPQQTRKKPKGSGLGLAITRKIVEMHGGSIRVAFSGPEEGTEFEVGLPLRPP
jgi:Na+/proline symporter/nitrogen-specific signal transduction histidine kinase